MRLLYTARAGSDLERLRAFIAAHDPDTAQRVAAAPIDAIERLR